MSELAAILGLVFVVVLFSFTYPQSALDLLLKATKYYQAISQRNINSEYKTEFLNVKGWFFLTDLLQFLVTFFIGVFVIIFLFLYVFPKSTFWFATTVVFSGVGILFYMLMLYYSARRITRYGNKKDHFMNREDWLYGKGKEKPFKSKFPITVFIVISVFTISLLIFSVKNGINHYFLESNSQNRLTVLGIATFIVLLIYLINMWGLYLYMPSSATETLCYNSKIDN